MDKTYIIIGVALAILVVADFASRKFFTEKQTDDKKEIKKSIRLAKPQSQRPELERCLPSH